MSYGYKCDRCEYVTTSEDDHAVTADGEYLCLACVKSSEIDYNCQECDESDYCSLCGSV